MKTYSYIILLLTVALSFTSCEEVINVDLNTAKPRLVIDAALKWEKGTDGAIQKIKLSTTTGYFDQNIPKVSGATEKLKSVVPIDKIEQKNDGGFGGKNIEVKVFYTDLGISNDYYMFRSKLSTYQIPSYSVSRDEFYQGNQIFSIYSNEDIKTGDTIDFTLYGISQGYFNYMQVLLSIAGSAGGSPFQSPPATVRGNVINTTDVENYALGFFSLSETDHQLYIVQ